MEFSKDLLLEIHKNIKPFINRTPVLQFDFINNLCNCNVYFKCENFQKTGSFKIRAASNALKSLSKKSKEKGTIKEQKHKPRTSRASRPVPNQESKQNKQYTHYIIKPTIFMKPRI